MKKFDSLISNYQKYLSEATNNPTIEKAVEDLERALQSSGTLNANTNAKELASKLFDIPKVNDPIHNTLKTIFDKIKENPNNPNITDPEREFLNKILSNKDEKSESNPENEEGEGKATPQTKSPTTSQPVQQSQQPNATQYNPLKQA